MCVSLCALERVGGERKKTTQSKGHNRKELRTLVFFFKKKKEITASRTSPIQISAFALVVVVVVGVICFSLRRQEKRKGFLFIAVQLLLQVRSGEEMNRKGEPQNDILDHCTLSMNKPFEQAVPVNACMWK